jgi:hypothetical protein
MTIWSTIVKRFVAPALPKPTTEYDRVYFDNLINILRLYFNQLDQLLGQIVTTTGSAVPISIGGTNTDAFGRLRTSGPYTLFDSQNRYAKNDLFDETTATGGTVTYDANASTVLLNVTTSSGSSVVRQTYRSFSYQPGKGLLSLNTFVMDTAKANVRTRVGYFNTQNGVFLERNGTTVNIVRRTYTSGAAVDTAVSQSSWNGDKLDGTGDSGYTLDLTKAQILWQDFEWLGVGSVRVGFVIDGQYIICHTFLNANSLSSVYMTTAILPVRYEIENVGAAASSSTLKQICSTVISEGGYEKKVALNVARMTAANTSISTTFVPLVSLRLASGRTGAVVIPDGYSVLPTATSATTFEIVLVKNPTLTGASWVASDSSNVEQDLSATSYTGGTIVQQQFVLSSNLANGTAIGIGDYNWDLQLGATISGTSDIYTLAVRTLSGTHNAIGSLSFWDLT